MLRGEQEGTSRRWVSAQPQGRGRSWRQAQGLRGADSQHVCGQGQPRAPPSRVRGALAAAAPPAPAGARLPACRGGYPKVGRVLAPSCAVPAEHRLCLLSLLPLLSLTGSTLIMCSSPCSCLWKSPPAPCCHLSVLGAGTAGL